MYTAYFILRTRDVADHCRKGECCLGQEIPAVFVFPCEIPKEIWWRQFLEDTIAEWADRGVGKERRMYEQRERAVIAVS